MLQRWGRALNLTSARNSSEAALRAAIDDSVCLVVHMPGSLDRMIDLGSGQGFPAIPMAIETDVELELIEADRRKAAFLTTALAEIGLRGSVHPTRIEATVLTPARCVTARALAPLSRLIPMAKPFIAPHGCALFLKGRNAFNELQAVAPDATLRLDLLPTSRPPSSLVKVTSLG